MTRSVRLAEIRVVNEEKMHQLGCSLAKLLTPGDLVLLTGPLGAGKTTLSRGIGEGLGVIGTVSSPTFVIARTHKRESSPSPLVHVDAYRLASPAEFDDLDIDLENSIVLVEWGRGFTDELAESWLDIEIERDQTGASEIRNLQIFGFGPKYADESVAQSFAKLQVVS